MKFRIIYLSFIVLLSTILLISFSGGPARTQGQDRTGSPLTTGGAPCQTCHSAGAFEPMLTVEILDNDVAVTSYEPEKTYMFRATIETTGSPAEFGFQSVALSGADNANAGTFGTPDADMSVAPLDGRDYFEHRSPRTEGLFEIEWTAPAAGTGDVRIYASCVAANNNNSSGGDGSVRLIDPVLLTEMTTSVGILNDQNVALDVFPNPVSDFLNVNITLEGSDRFDLRLFNNVGQLLQSESLNFNAGENRHQLDLSKLPLGIYMVQLSNGKESLTERILKQ